MYEVMLAIFRKCAIVSCAPITHYPDPWACCRHCTPTLIKVRR